jgi:ribonuclease III
LIKKITKFYNYYLSPDKAFARRIKNVLGFVPVHLSYYKLAFSHRSDNNTSNFASAMTNERLEFLGDAVLGTIVAEYLFKKYVNKDEGFLTKMRSKIVNRKMMNDVGDRMNLDVFLSEQGVNSISNTMLGNALEALIGAIYLDTGYAHTRKFVINSMLRGFLDMSALEDVDDNYKSQLLEWCQKNRKVVSYDLLARYKQDSRDRFRVAVLIDGTQFATAEDFTKKSAEQLASEKAMKIITERELKAAAEEE